MKLFSNTGIAAVLAIEALIKASIYDQINVKSYAVN